MSNLVGRSVGNSDTEMSGRQRKRSGLWRGGPLSLSARHNGLAYILLAPALLIVLVFIAYPLATIVNLSFRAGSTMDMSAIGGLSLSLDQYRSVLTSAETWKSLRISLIYTATTVTGTFLLGLATALLLNRRLPGRRWLRMLVLLPWPIPAAIASVAFVWMLDGTYGVVNYFLRSVGLIRENIAWFFNPDTALVGVLLPTIWVGYPLLTLIVLAALQTIPADLYESARVDGASPRKQFRYITWPAIRSASVLAMLLTGLWTFRTFDFVYAITQGGPNRATETLAVAIYNEAFQFSNLPYAAALGVVAMFVALLAALVCFPIVRKGFFK